MIEAKRGCGWRRVNGTYLVGPADGEGCHRLPWKLDRCPTCDGGIKPSRGWTWMSLGLFAPGCGPKARREGLHCELCVVCRPDPARKVGLLWIGGSFYSSPAVFMAEAREMGVSRRIPAVPKDFKLGETLVLFAHRQAMRVTQVEPGCLTCPARPEGADCWCGCDCHLKPAIFYVWKPEAVELILRQSDATPERVEREQARGVRVVAVPDGDPDHDPAGNGHGEDE